jgi:signal transduction histidine kinase
MKGFDKNWNYVGNKREATYTNLNPGNYIFYVKASNNDGVWNDKATSINIIIKPPWWQTLLFKVVIIMTLVFSALIFYHIKVAAYETKQKELTIVVQQRTLEISQANKILTQRQTRIEEYAENLEKSNELLTIKQNLIEKQANQLKHTNQQLSESNLTKDRFFSIIAHDIRNPFHVIRGFADILINDYRILPFEKIDRFLHLIYTSSSNGINLVDNLLQWSHAQTGHIAFDPANIKLAAVAQETVNLLEGNAHQKNIKIQQFIGEDIIVHADENMLNAIFRNLVSNAIKFTPENGNVTLKSTVSGQQVEVTIADSGLGIAPANQALLFNIVTNKSTKGTSNEPGTGLGLVLCKEFIDLHNGKIWVESVEGKGSKFKFTLPFYQT